MESEPLIDDISKIEENRDILVSENYEVEKHEQMKLSTKICLILLQICIYSIFPMVSQWALWDFQTNSKKGEFNKQSPYIMSFFSTVIVSNVLCLIFYGYKELFNCWKLSGFSNFMSISFFHGLSESMELFNLENIDATSYSVINLFRLPFVAAINFFCWHKKISFAQVLTIVTLFMSCLGHILNVADVLRYDNIYFYILSCFTTLFAAASSGIAGLLIDHKTKNNSNNFFVQISQIRFMTFLTVLILSFINILVNKMPFNIFANWNYRVVILVATLMVKDWISVTVLKKLSMISFCFCTAGSIVLTYILDSLIFIQQWLGISSLLFTLIISVNLILYFIS